jgi:hypothetical protein
MSESRLDRVEQRLNRMERSVGEVRESLALSLRRGPERVAGALDGLEASPIDERAA